MYVFKPLFYLVLIGLLFTLSMTTKNNFLIKTENAPFGIISLELSPNTLHQKKILKEWDSVYRYQQVYSRDTVITGKLTGLDVAIKQTGADNSFILFYISFLSMLFFKYRYTFAAAQNLTTSKRWIELVLMVIVAGLLDLIENSNLLKVMNNYAAGNENIRGQLLWILVPASLKFALLLTALVYFLIRINILNQISLWLQKLSSLFIAFVIYGWRFRIILFGLSALFFLMVITNQGQDLLVTINTSDWGIFWFFSVTTILALLNWHLPKIYDNLDNPDLKKVTLTHLEFSKHKKEKLDFARFLGLLTFLIPAIGVLITMQSYHISYLAADVSPLVIFTVTCVLYFSALNYNWLDYIFKPKGVFSFKRYAIAMALIFMAIIYFGQSEQTRAPFYLAYLSLNFYLLSLAFTITVSYRTSMTAVSKIPITPFIISAGLVVSFLFIACNFESIIFFLTRYDRFYTLPIVIASLIAYTLLFSFLLILGNRMKIQFITLFLLFVIYKSFTGISDFHKVHLVPKPANQIPATDLRIYSLQWLESRKAEITAFNEKYNGKAYPVFFVNAYGGGIKAAAWTTMVISRLDQLLRKNTEKGSLYNDFQHYAFSYSGVSGGSIGLSLLCAARISNNENQLNDTLFYPENSLKIYKNDFLTANLVGLFGRDALMSLIGFSWYPDRARIQEKNWEYHTSKQGLNYAIMLGAGWHDPKKEVPLFFSNTYDINTGFKGLVAPVILNKKDFPGTILLQEMIDKNQDLRLSTAAFISARFPYISPTAKFNEQHHFTDGGTLEKSGAETSLQVLTVFKSVLDSLRSNDESFKNLNIKFNFLSLPNSIPVIDSLERVKNLYEPLAPAMGILNSTNGNTLKADSINRFLAQKNNWNYFSINPTIKKIKVANVWPVLPLGWQISDYALEQMALSVNDSKSLLYTILAEFPMYNSKKEKNITASR
ncbi:hypothetical protein AAKU52_003434 [Pedobacter sp. CG_S7]|uniref:hypothetical protein n=1 Tax=Pedobacter sp. CG_S7 TaxID=3143930 RepID=UPI0033921513